MQKLVTLILIVFTAALAHADLKTITDGTEYVGDKAHPTGTYYFGRAQGNDEDLDTRKANQTTTYTKTETDQALSGKADRPTGTPDGTKFVADDGTLKTPAGSATDLASPGPIGETTPDVGNFTEINMQFVDGEAFIEIPSNTTYTDLTKDGLTNLGGVLQKVEGGVMTPLGSGAGTSLPDQSGQAGKHLTTDGTDAAWTDVPDPVSIIDDAALSGTTVTYSVDKIIALIQEQMGFPQLSILTPALDGTWVQVAGYTALAGTSSDTGSVVSVQWKIPSTSFVNATGTTSWTVPLITFPDQGPNTITVEVTDDQGNKTQKVRTINLDSIAPVVALGAAGTHDGTGTETFDITAAMITESNIDTVEWRWDTDVFTPATLPQTVTVAVDLLDHDLEVRVTDLAGNVNVSEIKTFAYSAPVVALYDQSDFSIDGFSTNYTGNWGGGTWNSTKTTSLVTVSVYVKSITNTPVSDFFVRAHNITDTTIDVTPIAVSGAVSAASIVVGWNDFTITVPVISGTIYAFTCGPEVKDAAGFVLFGRSGVSTLDGQNHARWDSSTGGQISYYDNDFAMRLSE